MMLYARFKHLFGIHTADKTTIRVDPDDDYNHHATCKVCGIDLTGHYPWE